MTAKSPIYRFPPRWCSTTPSDTRKANTCFNLKQLTLQKRHRLVPWIDLTNTEILRQGNRRRQRVHLSQTSFKSVLKFCRKFFEKFSKNFEKKWRKFFWKKNKNRKQGRGECPSEDVFKLYECGRAVHLEETTRASRHPLHPWFQSNRFSDCSYLVEKGDWAVDAAINAFANARPPGIYKQDYLQEFVPG